MAGIIVPGETGFDDGKGLVYFEFQPHQGPFGAFVWERIFPVNWYERSDFRCNEINDRELQEKIRDAFRASSVPVRLREYALFDQGELDDISSHSRKAEEMFEAGIRYRYFKS